MTTKRHFFYGVMMLLMLSLTACQDEEKPAGKVKFTFSHLIRGLPISYNEMVYQNLAGNPYEIKDIQWFISDISFVTKTGNEVVVDEGDFFHYVDTNLPSTLTWSPSDRIPTGTYSSIKFTFGLKGEKNIPGQFHDLPESAMIWPYALGGDQGGYHYMKLNGFWTNLDGQRSPFNFHLGVGQIYNDNHEPISYVQNWFEVRIEQAFTIDEGEVSTLNLNMNVNNWFDSPFIYDFNQMGGMTMTNQDALSKIKGNGVHAFTLAINPI